MYIVYVFNNSVRLTGWRMYGGRGVCRVNVVPDFPLISVGLIPRRPYVFWYQRLDYGLLILNSRFLILDSGTVA